MNKAVEIGLKDWFTKPGAYVLVDGQYGSTGKGVIAAAMAECFGDRVDAIVSNAGPNSGHTSYVNDEKIVLKQLPTFAVASKKLGNMKANSVVFLNAGAIIDRDILELEIEEHFGNVRNVLIHPFAARISSGDKNADKVNVGAVASTGQGVGPAMINKLQRRADAVIGTSVSINADCATSGASLAHSLLYNRVCFFEVSQGFSLGINSGFYPYCTSRECTVSQALSDASMSPRAFQKSILSVRSYPIRVGNTETGYSGPCYLDQKEITWEELGIEPEYTTVTKRVRRVFTWSDEQFRQAVRANSPDVIFLNFMNYVKERERGVFIRNMLDQYRLVMDKNPEAIILGYGPKSQDLAVIHQMDHVL